jgi:diguanylate cyclase (GGDEF)-like protein/PAS domain S-box-containing protein
MTMVAVPSSSTRPRPASLVHRVVAYLWPLRRARAALYASVAVAIVATTLLAALALVQLREQAQRSAQATTADLAAAEQLSIDGVLDAADLELRETSEEIARRVAAGSIDDKSLAHFLERQARRLPYIGSLRVYDEDGDLVAQAGAAAAPASVAQREFFQHARDDPRNRLIVGPVMADPTYEQSTWPLVRRIVDTDGEFEGIVVATMRLDRIQAALERVTLAHEGSIELRDADLGLVARRVSGEANAIRTGDRRTSIPQVAALAADPARGTFVGEATFIDPVERTYSYRRSPTYGFLAIAGVPQESTFIQWRQQASIVVTLLAAFVASTLTFAWVLLSAWRRHRSTLEKIRASEFSLKEAMEIARLGSLVFDLRSETWTSSEAFDQMFGIDAAYPRDMVHWMKLISPDVRDEVRAHVNRLIEKDIPFDIECQIVRPSDGQARWVQCACRVRHDKQGNPTAIIGTHQDITARKQAEETITKLAFYDQLTGLANRTLLLDRLRQALSLTGRNGQYGAIMLIDLDNFKSLNDIHGHEKGDLLLKQVAVRLTRCMRAEDTIARLIGKNTVARLGGDEFVVVLSNLRGVDEEDAATQAKIVASKVLLTINQVYELDGVEFVGTASIGVTLFRGKRVTIEELLKQADLAMYRAKASGRDAVCFFDAALQATVMKRAMLEGNLRRALDLDLSQFQLFYQAQVDGSGHVSGAEVLVRWHHPILGIVSPGEFIPMAEESKLILPMGRWVLETACRQLAEWAVRPEFAHLTIAVNVSAHQFHQVDFVSQVLAVLSDTKAHPTRLKLELTESLFLRDVDEIIKKMVALKEIGVGFALDDFGTGYSSLMYLKRLPLDQLKIDQSFVRDVLIDPNDAAIARTVAALGQTLGLKVIAEGVESKAQLDFLSKAGVQAYQGYYFSKPLPLADFEGFARNAWEQENQVFLSQCVTEVE